MTLLAGFFDNFPSESVVVGLTWALVITLLVVGFLGTFLPILPGTTMILAGTLAHYFMMGMEESGLTWQGIVIILILYIASIVVDWISGAVGAKWFGSSKWGILGAVLGGIVGIFFSIPGLIIGPIAGVFLFEMLFAKKEVKEASNSTIGTVVGGLAGIAVRVFIALGMIVCFLVDVFFIK